MATKHGIVESLLQEEIADIRPDEDGLIYGEGFPQEFWVVYRPGADSVLEDIVHRSNLTGLIRVQVGSRGAQRLQPTKDIAGVFLNEDEAMMLAARLLRGLSGHN
jgi:hypothetical protein